MARKMGDDAHAAANAAQLRLLLADLGLIPAPLCREYFAVMRPADLTPVEIADQLARMYHADSGQKENAPSGEERTALAAYLGCHDDVREEAWAVWCGRLAPTRRNDAAYWLNVGFIEPCLEGRPV
ncbi:hypothetical protein [Deinococcus aerophilus]|nr:hypothetical protein [Deinococcus aerophilus]